MASYLDQQRESRSGTTERAARLLGARLEELRRQVVAAESAVANYRAQHQLFAASDTSSITQQQLSVLDTQLAEARRSEEHTSELQSLMRISYAVFCLKKKKHN